MKKSKLITLALIMGLVGYVSNSHAMAAPQANWYGRAVPVAFNRQANQ